METTEKLSTMNLRSGDYRVVAVASAEQIIGTALSTVVGVMIPLLQLHYGVRFSSFLQGVTGASGLIGIAVGSAVIGRLMDRQGYLAWFRACPLVIMAGSLFVYFFTSLPCMVAGLFVVGVGVGGGYSLDSAYISEILPERWKQFMVGVAKTTCSLGFILAALLCWIWVKACPYYQVWHRLILIVGGMGLLSFLTRVRWANSPVWLMERGRKKEAQAAAEFFVGKGVEVCPSLQPQGGVRQVSWFRMFRGKCLLKVIFSGIPWACEGMGVYGFGVFLPVLVMALGLEQADARGIAHVVSSVEMTLWINISILPGFLIGLLLLRRANHVRMMAWGFIGSAVGLAVLWGGYVFHWPVWVSVVGFMLFEVALNAGPHLITFIVPSHIFPVDERGAGTGIAAMLGKVGAVVGVFVMPLLLEKTGMTGVLLTSIIVMLVGWIVTVVFGKLLKLT